MKVLILGGTQFLGRHIVEAMLAADHSVSILNRGKSPDHLPECVERLVGDRDEGTAGLQSLTDRSWDVCVDVSGYTPRQVRPSAEALHGNVKHYVFISAISVYGDPNQTPVTEAHPRTSPVSEDVTVVNGDTYGRLKVTCENIVEEVYGNRSALLRPQIVAGRYDPIDRFSYWVRRAAQAGQILAPGSGYDHVQFIDARDLARFTVTVIENQVSGCFNLAGPRLMWKEFMQLLGAKNTVWLSAESIEKAGLTEQELPLYRPEGGARSSLMHVSNEKAVGAGLTLTAPELTVKDTREWLHANDLAVALSLEPEAELIRIRRDGAMLPIQPES